MDLFVGAGMGQTRVRVRPSLGVIEAAAVENDNGAISNRNGIQVLAIFEAFQCVIQTLLLAAIDEQHCGLDRRLSTIVGKLWMRAVQLFVCALPDCREAPARLQRMPRTHCEFRGPIAAATAGIATADAATAVSTFSYSIHKRARTAPRDLQMKPALAVALIYLGCLDLGLPILAHQLVAWWYRSQRLELVSLGIHLASGRRLAAFVVLF